MSGAMPGTVGGGMRLAAALLLLPCAAAAQGRPPAQPRPPAQERPRVEPSRDVTVTYRVDGAARQVVPGGIDGPLRLSWDAARRRLRADSPSRPQAIIVDLAKRTALVVDDAMRAALPLPVRERDLKALTLDGVQMTRLGQEGAGARACTLWAVHAARGDGTVCLTGDGVAIHGEGEVDGRRGSFAATDVTYGAVAANLFMAPPDYLSLNLPLFGRNR